MDIRGVGLEDVLRVFTACPLDVRTLLLDVRDQKAYKKLHVMQSFNIRLAANGKALLVGAAVYLSRESRQSSSTNK